MYMYISVYLCNMYICIYVYMCVCLCVCVYLLITTGHLGHQQNGFRVNGVLGHTYLRLQAAGIRLVTIRS